MCRLPAKQPQACDACSLAGTPEAAPDQPPASSRRRTISEAERAELAEFAKRKRQEAARKLRRDKEEQEQVVARRVAARKMTGNQVRRCNQGHFLVVSQCLIFSSAIFPFVPWHLLFSGADFCISVS